MTHLLLSALIIAVLTVNDAVPEVVELLRQAAKTSGCVQPIVSMRSLDGSVVEVEVRCREAK